MDFIFTARIRRMREGNIFTLCVSLHLDRGGYLPSQVWTGRGGTYLGGRVPTLAGGYLPWPGRGTYLGQGVPTLARGVPTLVGGYSIACACYEAGGMPLAFTQEDFLVHLKEPS